MEVACRSCDEQIVDNALFCEHCGATQYPDLVRPSAVVKSEPAEVHDPWFSHFLRMLGVGLLLAVAWLTFILGLIWRMHILDTTGYRKRDVLWLWVPIAGTIAETRTLWRYTARDPYWAPRDDRPSDVMQGWQRPAAIAMGWAAVPIAAGIGIAAAVNSPTGECVSDRMEVELEAIDDGSDRSPGDFIRTVGDVVDECIDEVNNDINNVDEGPTTTILR